MRVVIVGGGMAGSVLAQALLRRGVTPVVIDRAPASVVIPGPIMLPYQAFDALQDVGVFDAARSSGRDVPPFRDGVPVAIGVGRQHLLELLREGVDVRWEHEVTDLTSEGGRVTGVLARGPGGAVTLDADIVVGADGARSRVRDLAGIEAEVTVPDTAFVGFRSPVRTDEAFLITFLADGRQLTVLDWPGGSAGSWQIPRPPSGAAEALEPGVEAFKRAFTGLLPGAAAALEPVTDLHYREVAEVRCETWWRPGVTLIGEALHAMNPEAGIGSGLGMADAHALAIAIERNPDDPDAALADYERWRRPAVDPYLAVGSQGVRVVRGGELPDHERWPPVR